MINAIDATLDQRPKAFDGIGVSRALDVASSAMINAQMPVSEPCNPVIALKFIGVDSAFGSNVVGDNRDYGVSRNIGGNSGYDFAFALHDTDYGCFARCTTPTNTLPFAADIGFIGLNFALKPCGVLVKQATDLLIHSPSRLISNTCNALQFFGRTARACSGHPVHSFEPSFKRRSGLVEYRASQRVNLVSASIAFIARPLNYLVVLGNFVASRTMDTIGIAVILKPFKASIVRGKLFFKVCFSVFGRLIGVHFLSPNTYKHSTNNTWCQGIVTLDKKGYAKFDHDYSGRAARYAYATLKAPIPQGLTIDHLCRNRKCVNPEHLEAVTNKENVLRGIGLTAQHAKVTHCPKGHPYNPVNTYPHPKGRGCLICRRATSSEFNQRTKVLAAIDGGE